MNKDKSNDFIKSLPLVVVSLALISSLFFSCMYGYLCFILGYFSYKTADAEKCGKKMGNCDFGSEKDQCEDKDNGATGSLR
jgi:hypothetical protein